MSLPTDSAPFFPQDDARPPEESPPGPLARMDLWLLFAATSLSLLGLVMVYSSGAWLGHQLYGNWEYFLTRQAAFLLVGFPVMLVVSRLDYRLLRRFGPHLMLGALFLLVLVLIVGQEINGAQRWIRVGPIGIQPSETAKVTLTIFLAGTLARQGEQVRRFRTGFLPVIVLAGLTMLLVLLERDLGTVILMGMLTLIMLFIAGTRLSYVAAAAMAGVPLAWQQILAVDYRRNRMEQFLAGDGYQVHQAMIGIGSGGAWGLGLGKGRQKLGFLPENHTDFVLATVGEELGWCGIVLVIGLLALLVWRGLVIAERAQDRFGTYLAAGLSCLFGLQALVNMGVVLEMIPAKGITLPFLSYGGSSLLTNLGIIGLLLSVSRNPDPWRLSDQRSHAGPKSTGGRTPDVAARRKNQRRSNDDGLTAEPTPI